MDFDPYAFLLAGGTLTVSDWALMPDEFQAVFIEAGRRIRDENASAIAAAFLNLQFEVAAETKMAHDLEAAADRLQKSQEQGT